MTDPKAPQAPRSEADPKPVRHLITPDMPRFVRPKPAAVEPPAVEPAAVEPAAVEPPAVEPTAAEPAAVEPPAVEPAPEPAASPALQRATILEAAPTEAPADNLEAVLRLPRIAQVADALAAQPIKAGTLVRAQIERILGEEVLLSVQDGPQCAVARHELGAEIEIGQSLHVYVDRVRDDGQLSLSPAKARQLDLWDRLYHLGQERGSVQGLVLDAHGSGLSVEVEGVKGHCTRRQLRLAPGQKPQDLIGQTLSFRVLGFDEKRAQLSLSSRPARAPQSEGATEAQGDTPRPDLELPEVGSTQLGSVQSLTHYGAFVRIGEVIGLLPIEEISWGHVEHPGDLLTIDQEISVQVLKVDAEKQRLRLSLRALQEDPWRDVEARYPEGSRLEAQVVSLSKFGAFVRVVPGLEGLVHLSELAWGRTPRSASEVVAVGDTLPLVVLKVDGPARKLSLSLKAAAGNPFELLATQLPAGSRLKGTIRSITDFGLFVAVAQGIDGLVHRTDLSWHPTPQDLTSLYSVGQSVEVMVLHVDTARQRIALGIKQLTAEALAPQDARFEALEEGAILAGRITRVVPFGAFVLLPNGLEGLLHRSTLGDGQVSDATTVLQPERSITVQIQKVEALRQRISLVPVPQAEEAAPSAEEAQQTPEDAQPAPEEAQQTPEEAQQTPEGVQQTPEEAQQTPEEAQQTPEEAQQTPEDAQPTPEEAQQTPEEAAPSAEDAQQTEHNPAEAEPPAP